MEEIVIKLHLLKFLFLGSDVTDNVSISVAKTMFENMEVLASLFEPITIGTMGTQKPYRFNFEQYVQEARTKMPTRKAAGKRYINKLKHFFVKNI